MSTTIVPVVTTGTRWLLELGNQDAPIGAVEVLNDGAHIRLVVSLDDPERTPVTVEVKAS